MTPFELQTTVRDLRAARERHLADRPVADIIAALATTAQAWLAPDSPWAKRAVELAPGATGVSPAMAGEIVRLTFGNLTGPALTELLSHELSSPAVLDGFALVNNRQRMAHGPGLITHILAGNVPAPGIQSICFGLLVKSANLVKLAGRDPIWPKLFAESLRATDADLGSCVAVADWSREDVELTKTALAGADAVIAFGDDRSLARLRSLAPPAAMWLGYGQKISFGYIAKEALTAEVVPALAEAAAFDVGVYDQQGCLSPHVIYVEERGAVGPREFAAALAQALEAYQLRVPRGTLTAAEAAEIAQLRMAYEFRGASDRRVAVWASPVPNEWLVIYEDDPSFAPSCLNRMVYVKPTDGPDRVLQAISRYRAHISTVGVAPNDARLAGLATELARGGLYRVCALGEMQRPPLGWYHDGRPNIAPLVRWTEW